MKKRDENVLYTVLHTCVTSSVLHELMSTRADAIASKRQAPVVEQREMVRSYDEQRARVDSKRDGALERQRRHLSAVQPTKRAKKTE